MANVNVQNTSLGKAYADTVAVSFGVLPTSGNHILVQATGWRGSGTPTACTFSDNQGNTYAQAVFVLNGRWSAIGYTTTAIGAPSGTFTVTAGPTGGTAGCLEVVAREYSGLTSGNPLDQTASGTGSTTTLDTTATPTTTQANELLLYVSGLHSANVSTTYTLNVAGSAPGSGWVQDFTDADDTNFLTHTMGSVTVSATVAARHVITASLCDLYSACVATFKEVAVGLNVNTTTQLNYPTSGPLKTLQISLKIGT